MPLAVLYVLPTGAAMGTGWGQWLSGTHSGVGTALGSTAHPLDPAPQI